MERLTEERLEQLAKRAVFDPDEGKAYYRAKIPGVSVAEEHWIAVELLELRKKIANVAEELNNLKELHGECLPQKVQLEILHRLEAADAECNRLKTEMG